MCDQKQLEADLARLRRLIDTINAVLLSCLDLETDPGYTKAAASIMDRAIKDRNQAATIIGSIKQKLGLPIHCPDRENSEIDRLKLLARTFGLQISAAEIEIFFRHVFDQAKQIQATTAPERASRVL